LVEVDSRVGSDREARIRVGSNLGSIKSTDVSKVDHIPVVSSHELDCHLGPGSGSVKIPANFAVSALIVNVTGTWEGRVGVCSHEESLGKNSSEKKLAEHFALCGDRIGVLW